MNTQHGPAHSVASTTANGARGTAARTDRRRGAMLGLAVGDALGAAVEFKPRGSFAPVTGYRSGGPHGLAPGEWTDDTSMALALADSLASSGFDLADQARRYVAWWTEGSYSVTGGCFDIGNATGEALARIRGGVDPCIGGDSSDGKSGNGSIMRLAPIAIHYLDLFSSEMLRLGRLAAESSAPTHRSPKCLSACSYLAVVLAALMSGCDREVVLAPDWPVLEALHRQLPLDPAILEVARGSYRAKGRSEIRGSGYVVASLEAALWAFYQAPSFKDAVLGAVNLGDDADTTGAICGQLAGAYFGAAGIPKEWLDGLAKRGWLEDAVERLGMPEALPRSSDGASATSYAIRAGASVAAPWSPLAEARHTPPTTRSYWVLPGRLLAGAYPGHPDPEAHHERVRRLSDAGIRSFINLMEEGEWSPQKKVLSSYGEVMQSMRRSDAREVRLLRYPIVDLSVPSTETMRAILDTIDASIEERLPVYVHCLGGIGRTGTVIGCWLRRHRLGSRDDVLAELARLRLADRERAKVTSPETPEQRAMVLGWGEGQ